MHEQPLRVRMALGEFSRRLTAKFGDSVVSARLFGSRARGEADAASDVDVAVVLVQAGWNEHRAVIDIAADVGLAFDLDISPTIFDHATYERWRRQEHPLVLDIEQQGLPL